MKPNLRAGGRPASFARATGAARPRRRPFPVWAVALLATAVAGALAAAAPSVYTTIPVADAFVTSGTSSNADPGRNYGGAGTLMVAGANSGNGVFESVLRFDLAPAKVQFDGAFGAGNWALSAITLRLAGNDGEQGDQPLNPIFPAINAGAFAIAWFADDSWVEGTGTPSSLKTDGIMYSTLAGYLGTTEEVGAFSYVPPGDNVPVTWDLDLTSGFAADAAAGNKISLLVAPDDPAGSYLFNARSYGTAGNRPLLGVTAVPEPSAALLAVAALGAAIGGSRRRLRRSGGDGR